MSDPFRDEKIQNWAAEFSDRDELLALPAQAREYAREIASAFLMAACRGRDVEPGELVEGDLKTGLLEGAARLVLPASAQEKAPELCALFVEDLQRQGRMAPGRALAPFVRVLRRSFRERSAGNEAPASADAPKGKTFVNPGSKLGLNDPCPCGSGLKYKKCCKRLL